MSPLLSCETLLHGSLEGPLDLNWGIYGPGGTLPSNKRLGLHQMWLKYSWIASFDGSDKCDWAIRNWTGCCIQLIHDFYNINRIELNRTLFLACCVCERLRFWGTRIQNFQQNTSDSFNLPSSRNRNILKKTLICCCCCRCLFFGRCGWPKFCLVFIEIFTKIIIMHLFKAPSARKHHSPLDIPYLQSHTASW